MSLINIGLSGMNAANAGLSVTAHNVSNVQTPGFSRLRVGFHSAEGVTGVKVLNTERIADNYLNQQIYAQKSGFGALTAQYGYMEKMEFLLTSDSTSINKGLDRFQASLSEASAKPQDIAYRQTILSEAKSLVHRFSNLQSQMEKQEKQVNSQLDASLSKINSLAASVAAMNKAIVDNSDGGSSQKELLDDRDQAISQLSELMDVNVTFNADGSASLTLAQGEPLVHGSSASKVDLTEKGQLRLEKGKSKFTLEGEIGGTVGGLVSYRSKELSDIRNKLDVMAYSFANKMNAEHEKGYDLDGNRGKPLFSGVDQIEGAAKNIKLNIEDPKELAFSSKPNEPGNNDVLKQLIAQKSEPVSVDVSKLSPEEQAKYQSSIDALKGKSTFNGYTGVIGDWAIKTSQVKVDAKSAKALLSEAQGKRDSNSGVNLDEEASKIMSYTQMYQANAKVISVAQQLFDVTLSMFR